ncbi:MAG TPA: PDZ domain-containing protein [Terriglobales bacterium]|nr:PDZ domain-containing protein [Terriglobales bacterium]
MKKLLVVLFVLASLVLVSFAQSQTRVYVQGSHGYKYVAGVEQAVPRLDAAGHDQTMELAKTFLERCPSVRPTINKEKADFEVTLNWTPRTRLFLGGKIFHKPDQIIVTTKDGDVIYSGIARTVGGDVDAACSAIENASRVAQTTPGRAVGIQNAAVSIPALGIKVATQEGGGAQIVALTSGGVAELAYLHVGDVINTVDGKAVASAMELAAAVGSTRRGDKVRLGCLFHTSALGDLRQEAIIVAQ